MATSNEFLKWIREKIEGYRPQPPETVWNNIADELDIEQVWQGVNHELELEKSISLFDKISYIPAAAVILLLLLPFSKPLVLNPDHSGETFISQSDSSNKNLNNGNDANITLEDQTQPLYDTSKAQSKETNASIAKNQKDRPSSSKPEQKDSQKNAGTKISAKPTNQVKEVATNQLQAFNINMPEQSIKIKPTTHDDIIYLKEDNQQAKHPEKGLVAFGVNGALKNSWLLNPTTYRGLERKNYTDVAPDIGKNIGIFGSFRLGKALKLQGAGNIISEVGQKYYEYVNGQYINRETNMQYYTLNVLLKIKTPDKINILGPIESDFLAGFYSGYLNKAGQNLNGEVENTAQDYKNYDFGLVGGYEFTLNPNSPVQLKPSLRINYGLTNIYAGNDIIPANFRKTRTASISINLAISFSKL